MAAKCSPAARHVTVSRAPGKSAQAKAQDDQVMAVRSSPHQPFILNSFLLRRASRSPTRPSVQTDKQQQHRLEAQRREALLPGRTAFLSLFREEISAEGTAHQQGLLATPAGNRRAGEELPEGGPVAGEEGGGCEFGVWEVSLFLFFVRIILGSLLCTMVSTTDE